MNRNCVMSAKLDWAVQMEQEIIYVLQIAKWSNDKQRMHKAEQVLKDFHRLFLSDLQKVATVH